MSRDVELWQSIQSGDQNAFSELYEKYSGLLYAHAYKMLNSSEEVEDFFFFGVLIEKSWFSHNATGDTNKHLFPIPTVELNKNNKLKQNPGY